MSGESMIMAHGGAETKCEAEYLAAIRQATP